MKILVCAFPAYADHPSNPAEQILARLNRPNVETLLLPFSWKRSEEALRKALAEKNPDGVLILNVSPFRHSPTLEQFAYNEEYEDQEISKSSITKVFKVIGALKTM